MIIFEIILFFLGIAIVSTSIAGYGSLINLRNNDSIFTNVFLPFSFFLNKFLRFISIIFKILFIFIFLQMISL